MYNNQGQPASPTTPDKSLWFDKGYLKTIPGILKIVELLSNLLGFILIKVTTAIISPIFFNLLYWIGIIITGFLLLCYMFHIVEKYPHLPWLRSEFVFCGVMALCYIGTSIFATVIGEGGGIAIGFFGLVAILSYAFDCFLKFKRIRSDETAQ